MCKKLFLILFLILSVNFSSVIAQSENVYLTNKVYPFLKKMKVKGILFTIHDYDPNLTRQQVLSYLYQVDSQREKLTKIENQLLDKYLYEFDEKYIHSDQQIEVFNPYRSWGERFSSIFSDRKKLFYVYSDSVVNLYLGGLGYFTFGGETGFNPNRQGGLYNGGFFFRGSLLNRIGYSLLVIKGGVNGGEKLTTSIDPRLMYNFKYIENMETGLRNYDYTQGYVRYESNPVNDLYFAFQIGRELTTIGYGYGDKLILSGKHPLLDFIKLKFKYGFVNITSMHASTVGPFNPDRSQNYTKHIANHQLFLSFPGWFDIGLGETVIYSRPLEIGYLSPLIFYKFVELSMQDRDNGAFYFGLQTHFWDNFEIQGTFFMDEDILSNLNSLNRYANKIAWQIGFQVIEPFGINDLSGVLEYTQIRPYVYSHINSKNTYSAFGQSLGHQLGPNGDEVYLKADYLLNQSTELIFESRIQRKGENVFDLDGNLKYSVGSDIFIDYVENRDPEYLSLLDGNRVNRYIFSLSVDYEVFRGIYFLTQYSGTIEDYLWNKSKKYYQYGFTQLRLEF